MTLSNLLISYGLLKNSQPTIETFQDLLTENPNIFHRRRTAKTLMCHWQQMKRYSLLSDQCSK